MKLSINNRYGIISGKLLNDPTLSLKAKGLYVYLQSRPDKWAFSVKRIMSQTKEGKTAIREAIRELEEHHLLQRINIQSKEGRWAGYDYILSEEPLADFITPKKEQKIITQTFSPVTEVRTYFINKCKTEKGFTPEIAWGKESKLIKDKLKRYSVADLKSLIDDFFDSETGEKLGYSISICLSTSTINKWKIHKLAKEKRPYYDGNPMRKMYGRWQVFQNGEWLEFAGDEEKDIVWK